MESLNSVKLLTSDCPHDKAPGNSDFLNMRDQFDSHFKDYWMEKYGPDNPVRLPVMGFKELDLFRLFQETLLHGGYHNVISTTGSWSKIWKKLPNYDPSITDSSYRLKKNYEKFLLDYEMKFYNATKAGIEFQSFQAPDEMYNKTNKEYPSPIENEDFMLRSDEMVQQSTEAQSPMHMYHSSKEKDSSDESDQSFVSESLPLCIGNFNLVDIGKVIPQYPFYDGENIWPIGYKCECIYYNLEDPQTQSVYLNCTYLDKDDNLVFSVTKQDNDSFQFVGYSPDECWDQIKNYLLHHFKTSYVNNYPSGIEMYGFDNIVIRNLLLKNLSNSNSTKKSKRRYNKRKRLDHKILYNTASIMPNDPKRTKSLSDIKGYNTFSMDTSKLGIGAEEFGSYPQDVSLRYYKHGDDHLRRKEEAYPSYSWYNLTSSFEDTNYMYVNKGQMM